MKNTREVRSKTFDLILSCVVCKEASVEELLWLENDFSHFLLQTQHTQWHGNELSCFFVFPLFCQWKWTAILLHEIVAHSCGSEICSVTLTLGLTRTLLPTLLVTPRKRWPSVLLQATYLISLATLRHFSQTQDKSHNVETYRSFSTGIVER